MIKSDVLIKKYLQAKGGLNDVMNAFYNRKVDNINLTIRDITNNKKFSLKYISSNLLKVLLKLEDIDFIGIRHFSMINAYGFKRYQCSDKKRPDFIFSFTEKSYKNLFYVEYKMKCKIDNCIYLCDFQNMLFFSINLCDNDKYKEDINIFRKNVLSYLNEKEDLLHFFKYNLDEKNY